MKDLDRFIKPNRKGFESDPFGYSALARNKWGIVKTIAGFETDISKPATSEELKDPILWLSQAHALAESAAIILKNEPNLEPIDPFCRGICDSQYCAVGLMMVGYSLEVCLKAMIIIKNGIDKYMEIEKKHLHHRLHKLADFIPDLNEKDLAILKLLTHFVYWAGRYPDPGMGKEMQAEDIFNISEKYEITAKELFVLAARVMGHTKFVVEESA